MKYLTTTRLFAAGALGLGSVLIAGLGVAVAASHGGTIHGCVAKSDGALRVVHSSGDCTSHEKALSFNAKGRRGPRGLRGAPASSPTFQMYANVDAEGHLGSNVDAESAEETQISGQYLVTFTNPVGTCAVAAQSGKVGGDDFAGAYPSLVNFQGSSSLIVAFVNPSNQETPTPFMLTVTCNS
jgi:hypothetical protein